MIFYTSTYPSLGTRPTAEQLRLGPVVAKTGYLDAFIDALENMLGTIPTTGHGGAVAVAVGAARRRFHSAGVAS